MDDNEVLQHLLALEAEAADLVEEAQAEADRRVSGGERQNRARHEEIYAREAQTLEASSAQSLADVKENYRKQLEAYKESLKTMPVDMGSFSSLAEQFLVVKPGGEP